VNKKEVSSYYKIFPFKNTFGKKTLKFVYHSPCFALQHQHKASEVQLYPLLSICQTYPLRCCITSSTLTCLILHS